MGKRHVLTDDRKVGAASAEVVHSAFTISGDLIVVSAALTFGVILTTNIIATNAERDECAVRSDYCRL